MAYEKPADYKEVPERIADLKKVHPDARLRPVNPDKPFGVVTLGDKTFIVYAAACYRDADDPLPGIGVAWEPFPGRTPYTRDSELMNAETSAWGRAIVAALRSESKAIASAEDVRNRRADQEVNKPVPAAAAKQRLVAAYGGDKAAAAAAWGSRGSAPISEQELQGMEAAAGADGAPFSEGAA